MQLSRSPTGEAENYKLQIWRLVETLIGATMRVWTCTFDYGTFQERQSGLASWADKRRRLLDDLRPGDRLVPYIARVGWVGVWITTSAARRDPETSPCPWTVSTGYQASGPPGSRTSRPKGSRPPHAPTGPAARQQRCAVLGHLGQHPPHLDPSPSTRPKLPAGSPTGPTGPAWTSVAGRWRPFSQRPSACRSHAVVGPWQGSSWGRRRCVL